jgi:V8-like Glu-specific endopeptidase
MRATKRWWQVIFGLLIVLCLGLGLALGLTLLLGNGRPSAVTFDGLPEVGALFTSTPIRTHTCTASVVDSPAGDVIVTAAHCLESSVDRDVFVPMFHNGIAPYGRWHVTGAYVDPRWRSTRDPHFDYAFLTVAPQMQNDHLTSIQNAVGGGNPLALKARFGIPVLVVGYPAGVTGSPIMCATTTYNHLGYPAFDCNGYVGGTSGSPWLVLSGPSTTGAIYGVLGGLQQGGATPSTSYSSPFGSSTFTVYNCARGLTPPSRCVDMRMP